MLPPPLPPLSISAHCAAVCSTGYNTISPSGCKFCDPGYGASVNGTGDLTGCAPCAAGSASAGGSTRPPCALCPVGSYEDQTKSTTCDLCSATKPNTSTVGTGKKSVNDCREYT